MSPERKRRFSAEEARTSLLEAGVGLVAEQGLDAGLGQIKLDEAIRRCGVPRGSAYRVFNHETRTPQERFHDELLAQLIERGTVGEQEPTLAAAAAALADQQPLIESQDPTQLAHAFREVVRVGTEANLHTLASSVDWYVYLSSLAAAHFATPPPVITAAHEQGEANAVGAYIPIMQAIAETFGIRLREGFDWDYLAMLVVGAAQGAALRWKFSAVPRSVQRPTGPKGEMRDWTAFGIALEGITLVCFEPDPDAPASADLQLWTRT